jgi:hypothetical protein
LDKRIGSTEAKLRAMYPTMFQPNAFVRMPYMPTSSIEDALRDMEQRAAMDRERDLEWVRAQVRDLLDEEGGKS